MSDKRPISVKREPLECAEDIELFPGFELLEHTTRSTRLILPSEFDVTVTRTGPYLYEVLDSDDSLKDLGPYTIQIHLMENVNPPGIVVDHIYEPPRNDDGNIYCPDMEEHPQAYAYYHGWRLHERKRTERQLAIIEMRKDLALVNCVKVNDGPIDIDDSSWTEPLSAVMDLPEDWASKNLLFLKTQVVSTETIRDVLRFLWSVEEVTIEGLKSAFDQFRRSISWSSSLRIV
jgi:hypothetical protein